MSKVGTISQNLTRGDKGHQRFMEKLRVFKDGMMHSVDSLTLIHKQTLDASGEYAEIISKCQESERSSLCEIIQTSEDVTKRKEAYARLSELDNNMEVAIKRHNEYIQNEREKVSKNILGGIICLAVASGLISNKEVRQMTGKAVTGISKNLFRLKE